MRARPITPDLLARLREAIDYDPKTGRMVDRRTGDLLPIGTKGRVSFKGFRITGARIAWALGTGSADFRNIYAVNNDERDLRLANLKPREEDRYDAHGKISRHIRYRYGLKARYGLMGADYDRMAEKQNFLCAICQKVETARNPRTGRPRSLTVDHDHRTGEVRELLCDCCNRMLGLVDDDPIILRRGIEYLVRHKRAKFNVITQE